MCRKPADGTRRVPATNEAPHHGSLAVGEHVPTDERRTLGSAGTIAADSISTQEPLDDETTAPPNARRTSCTFTRRAVVVEPGRRTSVVPEGGEAIRAKALGWIAVVSAPVSITHEWSAEVERPALERRVRVPVLEPTKFRDR